LSSEWRKRKRKPCEPNCRVIQAKLGPPPVKRFVPKPVVPERVACRCDEEGDAPLEEDSLGYCSSRCDLPFLRTAAVRVAARNGPKWVCGVCATNQGWLLPLLGVVGVRCRTRSE